MCCCRLYSWLSETLGQWIWLILLIFQSHYCLLSWQLLRWVLGESLSHPLPHGNLLAGGTIGEAFHRKLTWYLLHAQNMLWYWTVAPCWHGSQCSNIKKKIQLESALNESNSVYDSYMKNSSLINTVRYSNTNWFSWWSASHLPSPKPCAVASPVSV